MKKGDSYILKIDTPCHEDWTSMSLNETGRFCLLCSKTVIDFTHLTDNEIIQLLEKNSNNLCGRFTDEQLNRIIEIRQPSKSSQLYRLLAGLLFVGTTDNSLAIERPSENIESVSYLGEEENYFEQLNSDELLEINDSLRNIVQGNVVDSITKEPLSFVTVAVYAKGKLIAACRTDIDGKFKMVIPDSLISRNMNLKVNFFGYINLDIPFHQRNLPLTKELFLLISKPTYKGEVVIKKVKKK